MRGENGGEEERKGGREERPGPSYLSPLSSPPSPAEGGVAVAVAVAHPDDETIWAGGTLLLHPEWRGRIVTLCRASDPDRAPKFRRVLAHLHAEGEMGDLDDGPEQRPLPEAEVQEVLARLLGGPRYDLILTHGPRGEYTRHRRHEEVCAAVVALWAAGVVQTKALWLFAYDDRNGTALPQPVPEADVKVALPRSVWEEKGRMVQEMYGFGPESWEARAVPSLESFWRFASSLEAKQWMQKSRQ